MATHKRARKAVGGHPTAVAPKATARARGTWHDADTPPSSNGGKARPLRDETTAPRGSGVPGTASFSKFVAVLQHVADDPGSSTAAQLHKAVGMPRGTTHRIVAALLAEGLLAEGARRGMLELGPRLINLASRAWDRIDLRQAAHDEIVQLRDATGETVHLAVPSGREMVYIDKLESLRAVRMTSRIGARIPLYSTSVGKGYLAALDVAARQEVLDGIALVARTPNTLITRRALEADIAATSRRGYSIDREETEADIICYGCAIHVPGYAPAGCVSITIPKYRLTSAAAKLCREGVMTCAGRISARIAATRGHDVI